MVSKARFHLVGVILCLRCFFSRSSVKLTPVTLAGEITWRLRSRLAESLSVRMRAEHLGEFQVAIANSQQVLKLCILYVNVCLNLFCCSLFLSARFPCWIVQLLQRWSPFPSWRNQEKRFWVRTYRIGQIRLWETGHFRSLTTFSFEHPFAQPPPLKYITLLHITFRLKWTGLTCKGKVPNSAMKSIFRFYVQRKLYTTKVYISWGTRRSDFESSLS